MIFVILPVSQHALCLGGSSSIFYEETALSKNLADVKGSVKGGAVKETMEHP